MFLRGKGSNTLYLIFGVFYDVISLKKLSLAYRRGPPTKLFVSNLVSVF